MVAIEELWPASVKQSANVKVTTIERILTSKLPDKNTLIYTDG